MTSNSNLREAAERGKEKRNVEVVKSINKISKQQYELVVRCGTKLLLLLMDLFTFALLNCLFFNASLLHKNIDIEGVELCSS